MSNETSTPLPPSVSDPNSTTTELEDALWEATEPNDPTAEPDDQLWEATEPNDPTAELDDQLWDDTDPEDMDKQRLVFEAKTRLYSFDEYREETALGGRPLQSTCDTTRTGYAIISGIAVDVLDAQLFLQNWTLIRTQVEMTLEDIEQYGLYGQNFPKSDPESDRDYRNRNFRLPLEPLATGKASSDEIWRVRIMDGIGQRHVAIFEAVKRMQQPLFSVVFGFQENLWGKAFGRYTGLFWRDLRNWFCHCYGHYYGGHDMLVFKVPETPELLYRRIYVLYTDVIIETDKLLAALKEALDDGARWLEYDAAELDTDGWVYTGPPVITPVEPESFVKKVFRLICTPFSLIKTKALAGIGKTFTHFYYRSGSLRQLCSAILEPLILQRTEFRAYRRDRYEAEELEAHLKELARNREEAGF